MNLTLRWQGPVGAGLFPEKGDEVSALAEPGVYLRIKHYDAADTEARTVAYVGQSKQLIVRFDQHLRDILTFSSALRDDTGAVALARDGVSRYQAYNALGPVMALVAAEAARLRFYWATCEDGFDMAFLGLIEGALKTRLESQVLESNAFACENIQGIGEGDFDEDIVICHEFDALRAADSALLGSLLGDDPIHLTVPLADFDHVE